MRVRFTCSHRRPVAAGATRSSIRLPAELMAPGPTAAFVPCRYIAAAASGTIDQFRLTVGAVILYPPQLFGVQFAVPRSHSENSTSPLPVHSYLGLYPKVSDFEQNEANVDNSHRKTTTWQTHSGMARWAIRPKYFVGNWHDQPAVESPPGNAQDSRSTDCASTASNPEVHTGHFWLADAAYRLRMSIEVLRTEGR